MYRRSAIIFLMILTFIQLVSSDRAYAEESRKEAKTTEKIKSKTISEIMSDKEDHKPKYIGFIDKNRNGINDKFRDANGDGINDITKEEYKHFFKFIDKNRDKINDLYVDKDGDGVNDLGTGSEAKDEDEVNINVIDFNKDGINDITGLKYKQKDFKNLMGYRYGIVEEEEKRTYKKFIDRNGDGMHDPIARRLRFRDSNGDGINDRFVDEDGDGIRDGRRIGRFKNRAKRGEGIIGRIRARRKD